MSEVVPSKHGVYDRRTSVKVRKPDFKANFEKLNSEELNKELEVARGKKEAAAQAFLEADETYRRLAQLMTQKTIQETNQRLKTIAIPATTPQRLEQKPGPVIEPAKPQPKLEPEQKKSELTLDQKITRELGRVLVKLNVQINIKLIAAQTKELSPKAIDTLLGEIQGFGDDQEKKTLKYLISQKFEPEEIKSKLEELVDDGLSEGEAKKVVEILTNIKNMIVLNKIKKDYDGSGIKLLRDDQIFAQEGEVERGILSSHSLQELSQLLPQLSGKDTPSYSLFICMAEKLMETTDLQDPDFKPLDYQSYANILAEFGYAEDAISGWKSRGKIVPLDRLFFYTDHPLAYSDKIMTQNNVNETLAQISSSDKKLEFISSLLKDLKTMGEGIQDQNSLILLENINNYWEKWSQNIWNINWYDQDVDKLKQIVWKITAKKAIYIWQAHQNDQVLPKVPAFLIDKIGGTDSRTQINELKKSDYFASQELAWLMDWNAKTSSNS